MSKIIAFPSTLRYLTSQGLPENELSTQHPTNGRFCFASTPLPVTRFQKTTSITQQKRKKTTLTKGVACAVLREAMDCGVR